MNICDIDSAMSDIIWTRGMTISLALAAILFSIMAFIARCNNGYSRASAIFKYSIYTLCAFSWILIFLVKIITGHNSYWMGKQMSICGVSVNQKPAEFTHAIDSAAAVSGSSVRILDHHGESWQDGQYHYGFVNDSSGERLLVVYTSSFDPGDEYSSPSTTYNVRSIRYYNPGGVDSRHIKTTKEIEPIPRRPASINLTTHSYKITATDNMASIEKLGI